MNTEFKPYTCYFGKKYKGVPFSMMKNDVEYNKFLRNIPDDKKTKSIKFYLNWLDNQLDL